MCCGCLASSCYFALLISRCATKEGQENAGADEAAANTEKRRLSANALQRSSSQREAHGHGLSTSLACATDSLTQLLPPSQ